MTIVQSSSTSSSAASTLTSSARWHCDVGTGPRLSIVTDAAGELLSTVACSTSSRQDLEKLGALL